MLQNSLMADPFQNFPHFNPKIISRKCEIFKSHHKSRRHQKLDHIWQSKKDHICQWEIKFEIAFHKKRSNLKIIIAFFEWVFYLKSRNYLERKTAQKNFKILKNKINVCFVGIFCCKKNSRNEVKQDCKRWKKSRSLKRFQFSWVCFLLFFFCSHFLFLSGFWCAISWRQWFLFCWFQVSNTQ